MIAPELTPSSTVFEQYVATYAQMHMSNRTLSLLDLSSYLSLDLATKKIETEIKNLFACAMLGDSSAFTESCGVLRSATPELIQGLIKNAQEILDQVLNQSNKEIKV